MIRKSRRNSAPMQEIISIEIDMTGRPAITRGSVDEAKGWLDNRTHVVRETIIHAMGGQVFNLLWLHPSPRLKASLPAENLDQNLDVVRQLPHVISADVYHPPAPGSDGWC